MMSALQLLQLLFEFPEDANFHLQSLEYAPEEKAGVDILLSSELRQIIFVEDGDEATNKGRLHPAWQWFIKQKKDRKSICGLVFSVAEMDLDALTKVRYEKLLDELIIGALSRASTAELESWLYAHPTIRGEGA